MTNPIGSIMGIGTCFMFILLVTPAFPFNGVLTQPNAAAPNGPVDQDRPTVIDTDNEDSGLCPRSREEAAARGRQCLRKCKTDADCISNRKRCLCDGMCGWSCIRPDLNCDELPSIVFGSYQVSGDYFGARVTYSCEEGFYMSGARERVCQGDGSWSDQPPSCKKEAMCGFPNSVPHSRHDAPPDQKEFPIDALVEYECFLGYESKGFSKAKCLYYNGTAQWFGPDLKCIPRSCGNPGEVEHGRRLGSVFSFTSEITYACDEGFELVGRSNRFCQSNGLWTGALPSCQPVKCVIPDEIQDGRVVYSSLSYNSVIRYECRYGFKLDGPVTRKCGTDKLWEGPVPRCKEIDCNHPGILPHGVIEGKRTTLGSVMYFRCLDGMTFVGTMNSTTCMDSGLWSHSLPACMDSCVVPAVEHGRVNGVGPGNRVKHNEPIKVDCKPQFELTYNSSGAKCFNGSWTHVPICVPERCKQLPERPKNGLVIAPKTEHGMKALYRCRDGFTLVGNNLTTCHFGKWTEPTPVCQEIYCPFPGFLENGRILLVGHMGMYDYRPYVKRICNKKQIVYECDKGFFVKGPPGATCIDGKWSPHVLPTCERGSHPILTWFRRRRKRSSSSSLPSSYSSPPSATGSPGRNSMQYQDLRLPFHQVPSTDLPSHRLLTRTNSLDGSDPLSDLDPEPEVQDMDTDIFDPHSSPTFPGTPIQLSLDEGYEPWDTDYKVRDRVEELPARRMKGQNREKEPGMVEEGGRGPVMRTPTFGRGGGHVAPLGGNQDHEPSETSPQSKEKGQHSSMDQNVDQLVQADQPDIHLDGLLDHDSKVRPNWRRNLRGRRIPRPKVPCKPLNRDRWLQVDPSRGNDSYPHGFVTTASCANGYRLNLGSNSTARCVRGFWKPKEPECVLSSCPAPLIVSGGHFFLHSFQLHPYDQVNHGESVRLMCRNGYKLSTDQPTMTCTLGTWTFNDTFPACLLVTPISTTTSPSISSSFKPMVPPSPGSPCILKPIKDGVYSTPGFRSGLTVAHGTTIDYGCNFGFWKGTDLPPKCQDGFLQPRDPVCAPRLQLLGMTDIPTTVKVSEDPQLDRKLEQKVFDDEDDESDDILFKETDSRVRVWTEEQEEDNMIRTMLKSDQELLQQLTPTQTQTEPKGKNKFKGKKKGEKGRGKTPMKTTPKSFIPQEETTTSKLMETTETSPGPSQPWDPYDSDHKWDNENDHKRDNDNWCQNPARIETVLRFTGSIPYTIHDEDLDLLESRSNILSEDHPSVMMKDEGSPTLVQVDDIMAGNASSIRHKRKKGLHPPGTEVLFHCVPSPSPSSTGESKRSWRIICTEKGWVGSSFPCDERTDPSGMTTDIDLDLLSNKSCLFVPSGFYPSISSSESPKYISETFTTESPESSSSSPNPKYDQGLISTVSLPDDIFLTSQATSWMESIVTTLSSLLGEVDDPLVTTPVTTDTIETTSTTSTTTMMSLTSPAAPIPNNVLVFYGDRLISEPEHFPPSTSLTFRCVDIGKFSLSGSKERTCTYGSWTGTEPICTGLSQEHDYALEKAPTILFRHLFGPIGQSNQGQLMVYPGTTLFLECLWIKKYGNPSWEVDLDEPSAKEVTTMKPIHQGWTTEPGRDSGLEYRLSLYQMTVQDSGTYTCITPVKHRHSVHIVVKAINCQPLPQLDGLILSDSSTRMGTQVLFSCKPSMRLSGPTQTGCLPSGHWSNLVPTCIPCPIKNL